MVKNSLRKMKKEVIIEEVNHSDEDEDEGESGSGSGSDGGSNSESDDEETEFLAIATGMDTNCAIDMVDLLRQAEENNLNFVCVPLFHPRIRVGKIVTHILHQIIRSVVRTHSALMNRFLECYDI